MGAKVVIDGQVLIVAGYLTSQEYLFLQSPENYKPSLGSSCCTSGTFVMGMTIKELESLTGRSWVGIFGFCTLAMKGYKSLESAVNVLSTKAGHRIVKVSTKFYVAPILSDFDDDPEFPIGITLLEGERYINTGKSSNTPS